MKRLKDQEKSTRAPLTELFLMNFISVQLSEQVWAGNELQFKFNFPQVKWCCFVFVFVCFCLCQTFISALPQYAVWLVELVSVWAPFKIKSYCNSPHLYFSFYFSIVSLFSFLLWSTDLLWTRKALINFTSLHTSAEKTAARWATEACRGHSCSLLCSCDLNTSSASVFYFMITTDLLLFQHNKLIRYFMSTRQFTEFNCWTLVWMFSITLTLNY